MSTLLPSGAEGSVHVDAVLEYNEDPSYMAELTLCRLTQEARERFEASELTVREVARWLDTSPAQFFWAARSKCGSLSDPVAV
jgi:hypothetical protein